MSPQAPNYSGQLVAGRYRLHSLIGEGGFGRVYQATDERLSALVAIKIISPWWAQDPEWVQRFADEARTAAQIPHPGVVRVTDTGADTAVGPFTVSELVDGESLRALLERDGALEADRAVGLVCQAAHALGAAHDRRIVHRDVKPGNLLIGSDERVRVCDFGIARLQTGATLSSASHTLVGTPAYMAPEQAQRKAAGPAADQYALAVVLYEMLAGRPPFDADTPVAVALAHIAEPPPPAPAHTPAAVAVALARALAKQPNDRFPDIRTFAAAVSEEPPAKRRRAGSRRRAETPTASTRALGSEAPTAVAVGGRRARRWAVAVGSAAAAITLVFTAAGDERGRGIPEDQAAKSSAPGAPEGSVDRSATPVRTPAPPRRVTVPQLAGLPESAAKRRARARDLRVQVVRDASRATSAGVVSDQTPDRGARLDQFDTVRLTVSTGPPPVEVPQLTGMSLTAAQSRLTDLGLQIAAREVSSVRPADTIVGAEPKAGASLPVGSTVSVDVSRPKAWRAVGAYTLDSDGSTPPIRITGREWRITYTLSDLDCEYESIGVCSGPLLEVESNWEYEQIDLAEGRHATYGPGSPGRYRLSASTFDDSTFTLRLIIEEYS